ncbi:ParA family protein [bacterium]|nr:ParA family protein [bacterium]
MIIGFANQKGGVGKTSACLAFGLGMVEKGKHVLFVDMDPQGSLGFIIGNDDSDYTLNEVLIGKVDINKAVQDHVGFDLIPGSMELANADKTLTGVGKEHRLKEALQTLKKKYDYIVLDTPPALSLLTICALTACDQVIIPTQADVLAMHGLGIFYETFGMVRKYLNPNLELAGILLTKHSSRTNLNKELTEIVEGIATKIGTKVFTTTIRESVKVRESQTYKQSLYEYAPTNPVTDDCRAFVDEYLALNAKKRKKQ